MAGDNYDFPFTIRDVANLLPLTIRRKSEHSMYVDCFLDGCNHQKKGKLNINFDKDRFRCNYCNQGGGMLDLYARYNNINRQQAYADICEALRCGKNNVAVRQPISGHNIQTVKESQLADIATRHQTYTMLLASLSLSNANRENLHDRGLTDEQIEHYELKSTPAFGFDQLAQRLIDSGCTLKGVPGFYINDNGKWTASFSSRCSGILVPYRNLEGQIQSMQIRLDRPFPDGKYIWFSSVEKEEGVSSGSPVHFVGDPAAKYIYITEGGLKATIAHAISGKTFLAIAGTSCINSLCSVLPILIRNGTRVIIEAFDMDKFKNINVQKNLISLTDLILSFKELELMRTKWNAYVGESYLKGIDDHYLWKYLHRLPKAS